jgi:hypothetical protein
LEEREKAAVQQEQLQKAKSEKGEVTVDADEAAEPPAPQLTIFYCFFTKKFDF